MKIRKLEETELTTLLALAMQRQEAATAAVQAQQQAVRLTEAMASLAQAFAVVSGESAENVYDFLWESGPDRQAKPEAWLVRLEKEEEKERNENT
ncbi:MAG: hypothetical protein KAY24_00155 [Candidatus Eisenbacteria sp.]|nr:hypothetical protein [Candidatus Eisenbacteria bacterium]